MPQPLVSIIVPCYNTERYVAEALESALAQTYPNCEIVIVDDGSTDSSPAILDRYFRQVPDRIRIIRQANVGLARTRMRAIHEARGEFVVPLDADDRLHPEAVESWIAYWEANPRFALIYGPVYHIDTTSAVIGTRDYSNYRLGEPLEGPILSTLLFGNVIHSMCLIHRDKLLEVGGYVAEEITPTTTCEDYLMYLRLLIAGYEFGYVPRLLSYYRNTPNSMSKDHQYMINSQIRIVGYLMQRFPDAVSQAWYEGRQRREHVFAARERHFDEAWRAWIRESEQREQLLADLDRRLQENEAARVQLLHTIQELTARLNLLQTAANEQPGHDNH